MNWRQWIGRVSVVSALLGSIVLGSVYLTQATVTTTAPRNDYVGNGAVATYGYTFRIFASSDLRVTKRDTAGVETAMVLTTDYTVTGVNKAAGGTITLVAGNLPSGYALTIRFDRTPQQGTDLRNQGAFFAETHETKFDELTRYVQSLRDVVSRSMHIAETEVGTSAATTLPVASLRAGKFLSFDGSGNALMAAGTSANLGPVSGFINTLLDDVDATTARATLGVQVPDLVDAKGDLLVGSANNVLSRLPISPTTGYIPGVDPSASGGISWLPPPQPNPIINSNMEIWQRGTTFPAVVTGAYTSDRFNYTTVGAGLVTINRSTNVPSVAAAGVLFNYSLEVDVTTADAAIAASDAYVLAHKIEGYNWRHFAQRDFTVSFWVMSPKTGVHSVAFASSTSSRVYVAEYTIAVADTWEKKSVTVTASPSAGTWDYTNGVGLTISWTLMGGTDYTTASLNAWNSSTRFASTNQVNVLDNTANFFRITGVKMELGSVSTPIQFVPFEVDLARAQRYYQKSFAYATAPVQNAGVGTGEFRFPAMRAGALGEIANSWPLKVPMRGAPTITTFNPAAANAQIRDITGAVDLSGTSVLGFEQSLFASGTGNAATAVGNTLGVHWTADVEL